MVLVACDSQMEDCERCSTSIIFPDYLTKLASVRSVPSPLKMLSAVRVSQRRVDFVGEDVFGERFANRQVETCEQLA
jgi:hypothetical protein